MTNTPYMTELPIILFTEVLWKASYAKLGELVIKKKKLVKYAIIKPANLTERK